MPSCAPSHSVLAVAIGVSLVLGGCYHSWRKPDASVPVPGRFREAGPVTDARAPQTREFVRAFGSPELDRLVDKALDRNLDIEAAAGRILQADAQARIASASLWPIGLLNTGVGAARFPRGTAADGSVLSAASQPKILTLGLSASYEIDFWGKNRDGVTAADLQANASRFARDVVAISTISAVMNTYFQVLSAQDRLRIVQEHNKISSDLLDAIGRKLGSGFATKLDYAQQKTVWANQRALIPALEQTIRQGKIQLAVLVGETPESLRIAGGSLARLRIPAVAPGLPSEVLLRRPDISDAESRLVSQEFSVSQARASMFPSVQLTGQFGLHNIVLRNALRPEAIGWEILASLAQPILDGGRLRGQVDLQEGIYHEQAANYRKQILGALADVENALISTDETSRQYRLQGDTAAEARQAFAAARERLNGGAIDVVSLATNEAALFQSEDALQQARFQRFQSALALFQALGGGWSPKHGKTALGSAD